MNSSPYATTPGEEFGYPYHRQTSATPTPSPRGHHGYYPTTPTMRPATRAGHYRNVSTGVYEFPSPRPSPRYNSEGHYATVNVSGSHHQRKHSFSSPSSRSRPSRGRSFSAFEKPFVRASTPHGESDEEVIEFDGYNVVLNGDRSSKSRRQARKERVYVRDGPLYYEYVDGGAATDYYFYEQAAYQMPQEFYDTAAAARARDPAMTPRPQHVRRSSTSMPQRPQTARPSSSHRKSTSTAVPKPTKPVKATEADAKKHRIPPGYSLKNWDPAEEPILLLGSVFDADSLGKWIYDWTAYAHGTAHPISEMAGELWLLLIALAGKIKRADDVFPKIRRKEDRELIEEFLQGGERLMDKLKHLLKQCEQPMLKASKEKSSQLGKNAGVIFVETLFGRDSVLEKTEKFMQSVRTWNLRFDANCDGILKAPTA